MKRADVVGECLDTLACIAAAAMDSWRRGRTPFDPESVTRLADWLLTTFPAGCERVTDPGPSAADLITVCRALEAAYPGLCLPHVIDAVERARREGLFLTELARRQEHSPSAVRFCLALSREGGRKAVSRGA